MPRYEVEVTFRGTYEVEAANEEDAIEAGLDAAADDPSLLTDEASAELIDDDDEDAE